MRLLSECVPLAEFSHCASYVDSHHQASWRQRRRIARGAPGPSADMLLDIRIPEGLQSGETFQCEAEGIIFDLFVPEGYSGGQMLHLELLQDAGGSWTQAHAAAPPSALPRLRVLVAEDEAFHRDAFEALFQRANKRLEGRLRFEVTQVTSAAGVLETLRNSTDWQLVLLDVYMPDIMGHEIIEDVRNALGDKVPVLMVSAGAELGAIHHCLNLGADMCVARIHLPRDGASGVHSIVSRESRRRRFLAKPLHVNVIENLWQHVLKKNPKWFEQRVCRTAGCCPRCPSSSP